MLLVISKIMYWLFTDWLPIKSILFVIKTIYSNQFKWIYVRNKRFFLNFLLLLWNLYSIFNIWEKNLNLMALVLRNYRPLMTPLLKCLKCPVWWHSWNVNMLKGHKHCWNRHDSSFSICVHHSRSILVAKSLS